MVNRVIKFLRYIKKPKNLVKLTVMVTFGLSALETIQGEEGKVSKTK